MENGVKATPTNDVKLVKSVVGPMSGVHCHCTIGHYIEGKLDLQMERIHAFMHNYVEGQNELGEGRSFHVFRYAYLFIVERSKQDKLYVVVQWQKPIGKKTLHLCMHKAFHFSKYINTIALGLCL